ARRGCAHARPARRPGARARGRGRRAARPGGLARAHPQGRARARGRARSARRLGRRERAPLRRLHRGTRRQGVGAVLQGGRLDGPRQRAGLTAAGDRGRAARAHAASLPAPARGRAHVLRWHLQPGDHPHDRALRSGVRPRQRLRRPLRRGDREHPRAPRAVHACRRLHHVALPRPPLRARAGAAAPQLPARAAGAGGRREADADSDRGVAARPRDPLRVRVVSLRRDRPLYPAPSRARLRLAGRAQAVRRDRPARPGLERAASGPRRGAPARGEGEHPRLRHPARGRLDRRRARRARMAASPRRLRPARPARRGRARAAGARPLAIAAGRVRAAARPAVRPGRGGGARRPARAGEVSVVGERGALRPKPLPPPADGDIIPAAHWGFYSTTPDGHIDEIWTSPTAHRVVFSTGAGQRRFVEIEAAASRLAARVPPYAGNRWLTLQLSRSSRLFPPPLAWLAAGVLGFLLRRSRGGLLAGALAGSALLLTLVNALTIYPVIEFAVPLAPALVVTGAAGLVGDRRRSR